MHCHACDSHLPTDVSECFDKDTGRYYCGECGAVINDLIEAMIHPEKEETIPLETFPEEELLDEDFDRVKLDLTLKEAENLVAYMRGEI